MCVNHNGQVIFQSQISLLHEVFQLKSHYLLIQRTDPTLTNGGNVFFDFLSVSFQKVTQVKNFMIHFLVESNLVFLKSLFNFLRMESDCWVKVVFNRILQRSLWVLEIRSNNYHFRVVLLTKLIKVLLVLLLRRIKLRQKVSVSVDDFALKSIFCLRWRQFKILWQKSYELHCRFLIVEFL